LATHSTRHAPSSLFFLYAYGDHRDLHSFPTRRSSDLVLTTRARQGMRVFSSMKGDEINPARAASQGPQLLRSFLLYAERAGLIRSEEHTSELQSLAYLVCRLLLEKKKTHYRTRGYWT